MRNNKIISIKSFPYFLLAFALITANTFAQSANHQNKTVKIFVEYRLAKDGLINKDSIDVAVKDKTITLNGAVASLADKRNAEEDARDVNDTYNVINNLEVKRSDVPPAKLVSEVLKKIHDHVFYTIFDWVTASDSSGTIVLKGWAHEPWDKSIYQKEAEKVAGVTKIKNDIQNTFGPGMVGIRAARLIYTDPMFQGYAYMSDPPIHIIVENGSVLLKGKVDSSGESGWAANMIRFKTNAISVVNDLKIIKGT